MSNGIGEMCKAGCGGNEMACLCVMSNCSVMTVQIWPVQTSHIVYDSICNYVARLVARFGKCLRRLGLLELLRGVVERSILPYKI